MLVHEVVDDVRRSTRLQSHGEAARRIVIAAFEDEAVIELLNPYMWRDYVRGDFYWPGHDKPDDLSELLPDKWTRTKRLPIRFPQQEWRWIDNLASALTQDRAKTVAALLHLGIRSYKVLRRVAPGYTAPSEYALRKGGFERCYSARR